MVQDFRSAFGLGEDERHISVVDASGVALAAIQGLYREGQARDAEIAELRRENEALTRTLVALQNRLAQLDRLPAGR